MDFDKELGATLKNALRCIGECPEKHACEIAALMGLETDEAIQRFESLRRRGYIAVAALPENDGCSIGGLSILRVTADGVNYLELSRSWWNRFWIKSLLCPFIVSFVTALNAETVWSLALRLIRCIARLLPAAQQ